METTSMQEKVSWEARMMEGKSMKNEGPEGLGADVEQHGCKG